MVALWMIGYEDEPQRSAEICICEIFGRNATPDRVGVGMGLHPFGDPAPGYPLQFMLGIYESPEDGQSTPPVHPYPKQFIVDYVRGYRRSAPTLAATAGRQTAG